MKARCYWEPREHLENLIGTHWELEGNMLGTKGKRKEILPPSPPQPEALKNKNKAQVLTTGLHCYNAGLPICTLVTASALLLVLSLLYLNKSMDLTGTPAKVSSL